MIKKMLTSLFSRSAADLLKKGDACFASECYFEARTCYEDALQRCSTDEADHHLKVLLEDQIIKANNMLAEVNLREAEVARSRGDFTRVADHLALVKTLSNNESIREKAERIALECSQADEGPAAGNAEARHSSSSCSSCASGSAGEDHASAAEDHQLTPHEYYELLIQQLPGDQYPRYAGLGENFAYAYVAASHNRHDEALSLLDECTADTDQDIFVCEKGKILHRLDNVREAERCFRASIALNPCNVLAWLSLAQLLIDSSRFEEAMSVADQMVEKRMLPEQALLLRAELHEAAGSSNDAIDHYSMLLSTPYARIAAEKLFGVLVAVGRQSDAEFVFKKYLGSCLSLNT